jgi:hypothetical protein
VETVTVHFLVVEPAVALITARPADLPVTFPFDVTVATDFLLLFQEIFFFVPVSFKVALLPSVRESVVRLSLTFAWALPGRMQTKQSTSAAASSARFRKIRLLFIIKTSIFTSIVTI